MKEQMSETELYSHLHFYENHTVYLAAELEKSNIKVEKQAEKIKELESELNRVLDYLKLAGKKMYGASTEKICEDYGQLTFFDDSEEKEAVVNSDPPITVKAFNRKKKRTNEELLKAMPRKIVVHSLTEEEKICSICGSEMTVIGYDSFIQLEYHAATLEVVEHRKEKAVCRSCDKSGTESSFKTAAGVMPVIERSYVSPSLLAHIINEKYVKAVPLYRIDQEFKYSGFEMSRQTMDTCCRRYFYAAVLPDAQQNAA